MSASISEEILSQLRGASLEQISQQVGGSQQQTEQAISAALPLLLGALGKNAEQPGGAEALFGALQRDHANTSGGMDLGGLLGSVLGSAGGVGGLAAGLLGGAGGGNARQLNGEGILGHILGGNLSRAENNLSQVSGLNNAGVHKLLVMLAPLVMGYLGKQVAQGRAGNASILGSLLGQERQQVQKQGGVAGGLLASVLDQNGDGKLDMGDLMKLGAGFLNKR